MEIKTFIDIANHYDKIINSWHTMVTQRLYHALAENNNAMDKLQYSDIIDIPLTKKCQELDNFRVEKGDLE